MAIERDGTPNPAAQALEKAGIPFDAIPLPDKHASAAALGYPAAYVARTSAWAAGGGTAVVVAPLGATVDADKVSAALGEKSAAPLCASETARRLGVDADGIPPFGLGGGVRVLWDAALRRAPVALVPSGEPGTVLKVDTRHLAKIGAEPAGLCQPQENKSASAYDVLLERGFVERVTSEELARKHLANPETAAYIGFDPTADSLHVGSLVPIMALAHVQRAGGRAIALVGGGTGMIGDPSGRTDMRNMLTREDIARNLEGIRKQLSAYLELDGQRSLMVDNADWLADKNYIEFLREVGVHFSVNRMISAECFKSRMEKGLSFIEFNYMLLQAYDFTVLSRRRNCKVQMGGSDQWGNICAGIDLGRRMGIEDLAGVTFPLLQSASGRKFGKTEAGNVWLDPKRTPPHEFFQFWRNADDADVERFLGLFTFLEAERIRELTAGDVNDAKKVLAFAATKELHGEDRAVECLRSAEALFGGVTQELENLLIGCGLLERGKAKNLTAHAAVTGLPTCHLNAAVLAEKKMLAEAIAELGLASSRSDARRLIKQGGVRLNDEKVSEETRCLMPEDFGENGEAMVRVGKKKHGVLRLA